MVAAVQQPPLFPQCKAQGGGSTCTDHTDTAKKRSLILGIWNAYTIWKGQTSWRTQVTMKWVIPPFLPCLAWLFGVWRSLHSQHSNGAEFQQNISFSTMWRIQQMHPDVLLVPMDSWYLVVANYQPNLKLRTISTLPRPRFSTCKLL